MIRRIGLTIFLLALVFIGVFFMFFRQQGPALLGMQPDEELVNVGIVSEMDPNITSRVVDLLSANSIMVDYRCSTLCGVWVQPKDAERTVLLLAEDSKVGKYTFTKN